MPVGSATLCTRQLVPIMGRLKPPHQTKALGSAHSASGKSHAGRIWFKHWLCPYVGPQASHSWMHTSVVMWSLTQTSIWTKAGHVGAPLGMLTVLYLAGTRHMHTPGAPCLPSQWKPDADPSSQHLHWLGHLGAITSSSKSSPLRDKLTVMHSCHHHLKRSNFS